MKPSKSEKLRGVGALSLGTILLLGACGISDDASPPLTNDQTQLSATTEAASTDQPTEASTESQPTEASTESSADKAVDVILRKHPELMQYVSATSDQLIEPSFDAIPVSERGGLYLKYVAAKYGVEFVQGDPLNDSAEAIISGFWRNLEILDGVAAQNPEDAAKAVSGIYYYDEAVGILGANKLTEDGGITISGSQLAYGDTTRYAKGLATTLPSSIVIIDASSGSDSNGEPTQTIVYNSTILDKEVKLKQVFTKRDLSEVWQLDSEILY